MYSIKPQFDFKDTLLAKFYNNSFEPIASIGLLGVNNHFIITYGKDIVTPDIEIDENEIVFNKIVRQQVINFTSSASAIHQNGDIWYTDGHFYFKENGVEKQFGSDSGGSIDPNFNVNLDTNTLVDGQILIYENQEWKNKEATLSIISDINITNLLDDKHILIYSAGDKWSNALLKLALCSDITFSLPLENTQVLTYNNLIWENAWINLNTSIRDVTTTNLNNNDLLIYDHKAAKWKNKMKSYINNYKKIILIADVAYTVTADLNGYIKNSYILVITDYTTTITLPFNPMANTRIVVKDLNGLADIHNITILPSSTDTITNNIISTVNGCYEYIYTGTTWVGAMTYNNNIILDQLDNQILCDTNRSYTIYLPSIINEGTTLVIKDLGHASQQHVIINGNGLTIDGINNYIIKENYQEVTLISINAGWTILNTYILNQLKDIEISTPAINNSIIYDGSKWQNNFIDHTTLLNKGTYTHNEIDSLINKVGQPNGTATLNADGFINLNQIPSLAFQSVQTVTTKVERDALTNINSGDIAIITNDDPYTGSYIYTGTAWATLSLYINPIYLSDLSDYTPSAYNPNQVLLFNGSTWTNQYAYLSTLSDLNLSSEQNNQLLAYNGSKWINQFVSLSNLTDLTLSTQISDNDFLRYDNGKWRNTTVNLKTTLSALTDVITSTPKSNGQMLVYIGNNEWTNSNADNLFVLTNNLDPTKQLAFSLASISTGTKRTLIVPNTSTDITIIGQDNIQTLTNKTITDVSNIVAATYLRTNTTTNVNLTTGNPPAIDYILSADSNTSASWKQLLLSKCYDCSINISNMLNGQLLMYSTAPGINKWTQYTIRGASYNTTTNEIIVQGSTSLAGLTSDVTIDTNTIVNGQLLIYNGSKWTNSNADNLFVLTNNLDPTKQLAFSLASISTGTKRTLIVPNTSTDITITGQDNIQTLTNKTIIDASNIVASSYLRNNATNLRYEIQLNNVTGNQYLQTDKLLVFGIYSSVGIYYFSTPPTLTLYNIAASTPIFNQFIYGDKYIGFDTNARTLYTSLDGYTFSQQLTTNYYTFLTETLNASYHNIIWDGTKYIAASVPAVSQSGLIYSADGVTWTSCSIIHNFTDIAYNGTLYVAVGSSMCYKSSNGITWTNIATITGDGTSQSNVCYNGNTWLVVTGNGTWKSTDNGGTWVSVTVSGTLKFNSCAYNSILSMYVVAGSSGVYRSSNLTTWTSVTCTYTSDTFILNSYNTYIIKYGKSGTIEYSANGTSWTPLTIPSGTLYGHFDIIPILYFKNSSTVIASAFKSATTVIDVGSATAPTNGQSLVATSGTTAIWTNVDHTTLTNIGTNTHAQIDANLYSLQFSTGVTKAPTGVTANTIINTTYTNETDNNVLYTVNTTNFYTYLYALVSFNVNYGNYSNPVIKSTKIEVYSTSFGGGWSMGYSGASKIGVDIGISRICNGVYISQALEQANSAGNLYVLGSNTLSDFNSSNATITGTMTTLATLTYPFAYNLLMNLSNTVAYRYIFVIVNSLTAGGAILFGSLKIQIKAGTYPLLQSDYTITTNATTGLPVITYSSSQITNNLLYNMITLLLYESHRRLYPVIRDKNQIVLTDGTNTTILTSTSIVASALKYSSGTISISPTTPVAGQFLGITSTSLAEWKFPGLANLTTDVLLTSTLNNDILKYNGTMWINDNKFVNSIITCKSLSSVVQGTEIKPVYTEGSDAYILRAENTAVSPYEIFTINSYGSASTTLINNNTAVSFSKNFDTPPYKDYRLNIRLNYATTPITSIVFSTFYELWGYGYTISVYASNNNATYLETSNTVSNATLLWQNSTSLQNYAVTIPITTTTLYTYIHVTITTGGLTDTYSSTITINRPISIYGLNPGTDYTITTDSNTGNPIITYTRAATKNLVYSYSALALYTLYDHIFPVIRSKNQIVLTDGTNTTTLTSTSIAATALRSVVISATAPSNGKVLTATSTSTAEWRSSITSLAGLTTDVAFSLLASGNVLRYNGTAWVNSSTLTDVENSIVALQLGTSILKTQINVAPNTDIITTYTDGTDGTIAHVNNSSSYYNTPTGMRTGGTNLQYTGGVFGTWLSGFGGPIYNSSQYIRCNGAFQSPFPVSSVNVVMGTYGGCSISIYGSNSITSFNDTSNSTAGLTLIYQNMNAVNNATYTISNVVLFQYICIIWTTATSGDCYPNGATLGSHGVRIQRAAGGYIPLVVNTNFTISSNASTGVPVVTYTDSSTNNVMYNETTLLLYEAYRRIYPVIRSKNQIVLTDGTTPITLTNTSGYPLSLASDASIAAPVIGNVLIYNGTKWINRYNNMTTRTFIPTASPYSITKDANNYVTTKYIYVNTISITYTINLPTTPIQNTTIIIFDYNGNAATRNITVVPGTGATITNGTINVNNRAVSYNYVGTIWTGTVLTNMIIDIIDNYIICDTTTDSYTLYLPSTLPVCGTKIMFKDTGNASVNNITINANGSTIDGVSTYALNTNYTKVALLCDNTKWFIV